ncbi:hypothetical protein GQ44DRAFT_639238 [Phaeosphaeriaceae sp. PMI808]|nr:hypothetical protein GQ44DRAFT_639238 [Phaeosphaeriaceae sp. PMI808]
MTGVFETATGAFAVVGVADVLVRIGRELYRFFCDISDAPNSVQRLNDCIDETVLLAGALRKCTQINIDATTLASLVAAAKALSRQLNTLKGRLSKLKGAKSGWSRVKYVLDEKKIEKVLMNMERSKSIIGNTLTLKISNQMTQVGSLAQQLTSSLDTHHQSLSETLSNHEKQRLANAEKSQLRISNLQHNQTNILSRQESLARVSKRTEKQTAFLSRQVQEAQRCSAKEHRNTRDLPSSKVYFFGELLDMIMTYLLPVREEVDTLANHVLANFQDRVDIQDMFAIRDEFRRLLASASQEEATRYPMSTATSFDEWHFPNGSFRSTKSTIENDKRNGMRESVNGLEAAKPKMQTLTIETASSTFQLIIPRKENIKNGVQKTCDLRLSVTSRSEPFVWVDVQFTQSLLRRSRSQICTHLNVHTLATSSQDDILERVLEDDISIKDFDCMIRQGVFSPYHVNSSGVNLMIRYAVRWGRIGVLKYLESQGVRITALPPESSMIQVPHFFHVLEAQSVDVQCVEFTAQNIHGLAPLCANILLGGLCGLFG